MKPGAGAPFSHVGHGNYLISSTPAQEPVDVKDLLYGFREGEYSNQVLIINQLSWETILPSTISWRSAVR